MQLLTRIQHNDNMPIGAALLAVFLALSFLAPLGSAQVTAVSTDKASYEAGDSMTISGSAAADALVALQVSNPKGTMILLVTATAGSDDSFSRTFKLPADSVEGTYVVTASEGGVTRTATFTVVPTPAPSDPVLVVNAIEAALNAHDVDAAIALVADDAFFVIVPPMLASTGVFAGKDEIRGWIQDTVNDNIHIEGDGRQVEGNKVTTAVVRLYLDSLQALDVFPLVGSVEHVVQDGKIMSATFTFNQESLAKLQLTLTVMQPVVALSNALNAQDVEAALALYAEDAVVTSSDGVFTGKTQIRSNLQFLVNQNIQSEVVGSPQVEGDKVSLLLNISLDIFRDVGVPPLEHMLEAVVQDGKIKSQTVTITPESAAILQAGATEAQIRVLRGEFQELRSELESLKTVEMEILAVEPGPAGELGPAGLPGPPGPAGEAADPTLLYVTLAIAIIGIAIAGVTMVRAGKKKD